MPQCTTPIFIRRPKISWSNVITVISNTRDGTNTTFQQPLFSANTENGSYLDYIRVKSLGSNFTGVARIFLNNGGNTTNAVNNSMMAEISLPISTWSETITTTDVSYYTRLAIPAGWNVYVSVANSINATAGWNFTAVGGDYERLPGGAQPIFLQIPKMRQSNTLLTQNQTRTGVAGTLTQVFAANTANGSYLDYIKAKPLGTNVVTVARIFLNNGGATTVVNNNVLFSEVNLPATTLSEVAGLTEIPIGMKLPLPPGYNVFVTLGTTVAAGWTFLGVGGDY